MGKKLTDCGGIKPLPTPKLSEMNKTSKDTANFKKATKKK